MPGSYALSVGFLLLFAAAANGAYDLWSATIVYGSILILSVSVLFHQCWPRRPIGVFYSYLPFMAAVAAVFTISHYNAVHPAESFQRWLDCMTAIALFWSALHIFQSEKFHKPMLAAIVPVMWIQMIAVLHFQITGLFFRGQPGGTLVNANVAAAFLLLWLPVIGDRALRSWRAREPYRLFWASGLVANLVALTFTYSTFGTLCLMACLPLFARPRNMKKIVSRYPRLLGAAATIVVAVAGFMIWYKFTRVLDLAGKPMPPGENTRRFGWWMSGVRMFLDHPGFGVGIGNFPSAYLAYQPNIGGSKLYAHTLFAHSFLITLIAETGAWGTLSVGAFFLYWCGRLARGFKEWESRWPYLTGLVLLLLFSSINIGLEFLAVLLSAALFAGILAAPIEKNRVKLRKAALLSIAGLSLFCAPYILAPFLASRNCAIAREWIRAGEIASARRAFADAASMDPRSSEARRGWARASFEDYRRTGDKESLAEAVSRQQEAVSLNSLNGIFRWELGLYLRDQGNTREALGALRRAARLNPGHLGIRRDLEELTRS